jgi:hypothetical protein
MSELHEQVILDELTAARHTAAGAGRQRARPGDHPSLGNTAEDLRLRPTARSCS